VASHDFSDPSRPQQRRDPIAERRLHLEPRRPVAGFRFDPADRRDSLERIGDATRANRVRGAVVGHVLHSSTDPERREPDGDERREPASNETVAVTIAASTPTTAAIATARNSP